MRLTEAAQKIITDQGGNIVKTEMMGKRRLAYEINHKRDGVYVLLEVEGSGREIAEFERRMRVNDRVLRYMTVRVDEYRRRAQKLKDRRARKAERGVDIRRRAQKLKDRRARKAERRPTAGKAKAAVPANDDDAESGVEAAA